MSDSKISQASITAEPYDLLIINGNQKPFKLSDGIGPATKVSELRKKIADRIGESNPDDLRILFRDKRVEKGQEHMTLKDLGIESDSSIYVVYRVFGGGSSFSV